MYKRINITLSEDVLARADEFAARERYTRSGLISAALEAFVAGDGAGTGGESLAAETPASYGSTIERPGLELDRVEALLNAFFSARDDVEAAWVFGSVVRGTAGPMSDVDVAVLPKGEPDGDARWRMRLDLSSRLSGVLGVSEVDVAVLPDVSVLLGHRALVQGVRVHGSSSREAAEAEIAAFGAHCDFEPVRRMQAARLSERLGLDGTR